MKTIALVALLMLACSLIYAQTGEWGTEVFCETDTCGSLGSLVTGADSGINNWDVVDDGGGNYYLWCPDLKTTPGTLSYVYLDRTIPATNVSWMFFHLNLNVYTDYSGLQVQISVDGGGFVDIGSSRITPGYNSVMKANVGNPLQGQDAYSSNLSTGVRVNLTTWAGHNVLVRWAYASNKFKETPGGGVQIDNVSVWNDPLLPPSLTTSGDNSSLTASWTGTTDPRVVGYNLYLNDVFQMFTSRAFHQFTGLTPGNYKVEVRTTDAEVSGNESPPGLAVVTGVAVTCNTTPASPLMMAALDGSTDIRFSWEEQTIALPAGCVPGAVDSLTMRRSIDGPQGPWVEYPMSGGETSWYDWGGTLDPSPVTYYSCHAVKNSVTGP